MNNLNICNVFMHICNILLTHESLINTVSDFLTKIKMKIISSICLCMLLVCGVSMGDKAEFWVDGMHIKILVIVVLGEVNQILC